MLIIIMLIIIIVIIIIIKVTITIIVIIIIIKSIIISLTASPCKDTRQMGNGPMRGIEPQNPNSTISLQS